LKREDFHKVGDPRMLVWAESQPAWVLISVGVLMDLALGFIDYATGFEVSFSVFYLLPLALVARYVGLAGGLFMSVLAAVTWLAADLTSGHDYSDHLIPLWNTLVRLGFFVTLSMALDSIKSRVEELRELAELDPLTGISNRKGFAEKAALEMDRAARYKHTFALAFLDLDDFKIVNDTFGHSEGDRLLLRVAGLLRSGTRKTDITARLGGDEFAVLFPETGPEEALSIANRLRESISEEMAREGRSVGVSVGLATFLSPPGSVDAMVRETDGLMYKAKTYGKNRIVSATVPETSRQPT
jgi:diguanylate cyclase (GGDEF)-like protein